jgi:NAD(P)-dependent dehydrogenase (short-subunit alcohol dehydrogenase family)
MMQRIMEMSGNAAAEERFIKGEPLRRFGQPEEIGEAVAWLCSDRASYVTGIPMPVDGGAIAQ